MSPPSGRPTLTLPKVDESGYGGARSSNRFGRAASHRSRSPAATPGSARASTPGSCRIERSCSQNSIMLEVRNEMLTLTKNNAAGLIPLPRDHECSPVEETGGLWNHLQRMSGRTPSRRSQECSTPHRSRSRIGFGSRTPGGGRTPGASRTPKARTSKESQTPCSSRWSCTPKADGAPGASSDPAEPRQKSRCTIPFRLAMICPTFAMIFVSSAAYVALAYFSNQTQASTLEAWRLSNTDMLEEWKAAVFQAQKFVVKEKIELVERRVHRDILKPPGQAVDTLLGAVSFKHQTSGWKFAGESEKEELRFLGSRAWEALGMQWNSNHCQFAGSQACSGHADSLYAYMHSGGFTGAFFALFNGSVQPRLVAKVAGENLQIFPANDLTGERDGHPESIPGYDPKMHPSVSVQANMKASSRRKAWTQLYLVRPWVKVSESPNYYRKESGVGVWGGLCECPNGEIYQVGDYNNNCQSLACEGGVSTKCSSTGIISQNAGRKVTCNASQQTSSLSQFLAISRTAPISLNNEFDGVVGSDVSLRPLSDILWNQWRDLRDVVKSMGFTVQPDQSSIFIVQQRSPLFPEQVGTLIGTSQEGWFNTFGGELTPANESSLPLVASVSRALLANYSGWDDRALMRVGGDEVFYFSQEAMKSGRFVCCHTLKHGLAPGPDCVQVATRSMSLDESVRWLIVVALPSEAFFTSYINQVSQTIATRDGAQDKADYKEETSNLVCIVIIAIATIISVLVASVTSCLVLRPLSRLGEHMEQLCRLEYCHKTPEYAMVQTGARGCVREVNVLRDGFCRVSQSIETFAKFVPDTIVRSLVSCDEQRRQRFTRLHVDRKKVTIMFSDVADFTTISEKLPQKQLLFLLTLYLTVMTRIVEYFDGVVGEVLGDGLLCFWNTPDNIADHAKKACMTALAQQQALGPLNLELAKRGLPQLQIRIGLHTGYVLTGNIGSEKKMKFGCMGDPVNLASRLEGLCKVYGVGVMCSGATLQAISKDDDVFVTRRLDLVQVKGKSEPTEIFELIGCHHPEAAWGIEPVASTQIRQAVLYEQALTAYQKANFADAVQLAEALEQQRPEDVSVKRLLERARRYDDDSALWYLDGTFSSPSEEVLNWTGVEKMLDK